PARDADIAEAGILAGGEAREGTGDRHGQARGDRSRSGRQTAAVAGDRDDVADARAQLGALPKVGRQVAEEGGLLNRVRDVDDGRNLIPGVELGGIEGSRRAEGP